MNTIVIFMVFIPILSAILLVINVLLAPSNPYKEKKTPFECGYHSFTSQTRSPVTVSFFTYIYIFLILDIEIITAFPFTTASYTNGPLGLFGVIIFIVILTLGLVFELGKNALTISSKQDKVVSMFNNYIKLTTPPNSDNIKLELNNTSSSNSLPTAYYILQSRVGVPLMPQKLETHLGAAKPLSKGSSNTKPISSTTESNLDAGLPNTSPTLPTETINKNKNVQMAERLNEKQPLSPKKSSDPTDWMEDQDYGIDMLHSQNSPGLCNKLVDEQGLSSYESFLDPSEVYDTGQLDLQNDLHQFDALKKIMEFKYDVIQIHLPSNELKGIGHSCLNSFDFYLQNLFNKSSIYQIDFQNTIPTIYNWVDGIKTINFNITSGNPILTSDHARAANNYLLDLFELFFSMSTDEVLVVLSLLLVIIYSDLLSTIIKILNGASAKTSFSVNNHFILAVSAILAGVCANSVCVMSVHFIENLIIDISHQSTSITLNSINELRDLIIDISHQSTSITLNSINVLRDLITDISHQSTSITLNSINVLRDLITDISHQSSSITLNSINGLRDLNLPFLINDFSSNSFSAGVNGSDWLDALITLGLKLLPMYSPNLKKLRSLISSSPKFKLSVINKTSSEGPLFKSFLEKEKLIRENFIPHNTNITVFVARFNTTPLTAYDTARVRDRPIPRHTTAFPESTDHYSVLFRTPGQAWNNRGTADRMHGGILFTRGHWPLNQQHGYSHDQYINAGIDPEQLRTHATNLYNRLLHFYEARNLPLLPNRPFNRLTIELRDLFAATSPQHILTVQPYVFELFLSSDMGGRLTDIMIDHPHRRVRALRLNLDDLNNFADWINRIP